MKPQTRQILRLLETHPEGITQQTAIAEASCYRLGGRIFELIHEHGYRIRSELVSIDRVRFARYTLEPTEVQVTLFFAEDTPPEYRTTVMTSDSASRTIGVSRSQSPEAHA